jgi:predicted transglutaminase-like cysteine proteinase
MTKGYTAAVMALLLSSACHAATLAKGAGDYAPFASVLERSHILPARQTITAGLVERINRDVNRAPYVEAATDAAWETPDELRTHGGACRDYAVAKYVALRSAGIADDDLRVEIVRDGAAWHAVLDVRVSREWLMLDSRSDGVMPRALARYRSVYLINGSGWWYWQEGAKS